MALKALLALANRMEKRLKNAVDVDAVESYPGSELESGEHISAKAKLQNAKETIVQDLNSIASNYYMHESQAKQAQTEMQHALFVLPYAKRVQELINSLLATDEPNLDMMESSIKSILQDAMQAFPGNRDKLPNQRKKQPLAELTSLRLLSAIIEDERNKHYPKMEPPDYVALSKRNREEAAEDEVHKQEQEPTVQRPSTTLKSRQEVEPET